LRLMTSLQRTHILLLREYRVHPVIKHDVKKPEVDLTRHDPEGVFSEKVCEFIKARDFENSPEGIKVDVISLATGEKRGTVEVNNFVFGANPRIDILHRNMVWYLASIRAGNAHRKDRSEMRGGGRKPWPQKGSGRARHGSIRSPIWLKGGSAKGPRPRDWSYELPHKLRRMGLRTALSCRLAQGDLTIVEDLVPGVSFPTEQNEFLKLFHERGLRNSLVVDAFENEELDEITREIHMKHKHRWELQLGVDKPDERTTHPVNSTNALFLHVYGILIRKNLVLSLDALRVLEEKLCEDGRIVTLPHYSLYHEDMLLDKNLLFTEYDVTSRDIAGRLIPNRRPKNSIRKKPPMSRQDFK